MMRLIGGTMKRNTAEAGLAGGGATHRGMRRTLAIIATAGLALFLAGVATPPHAAQAAPYGQCDSLFNTPGLGLDCTVTVVNNLDLATGVTSSTTTYTRCSGAANTALSCEGPTTVSSTALVTSVSQCNSSLDGGGASMHCSVYVTNNIVGDATAIGATVNQCNGSLGGGGIVLRACNPDPASTGGATVDQCNNSVNGGGSSLTCTVSGTTTAALNVTVSQCNYSANGGGSLIVCTTGMTNNITPAVVVPPVEEEEETPPPPTDTGVTPPTGGPRSTSEVLGSHVVAGGSPEALAYTGAALVSPLKALSLVAAGTLLLVGVRHVRRRTELAS